MYGNCEYSFIIYGDIGLVVVNIDRKSVRSLFISSKKLSTFVSSKRTQIFVSKN
jgi:hypothetical protein